ncbi:MAG: Rne/Rng family ribonuclease [Hyphomicrobiaceae bacterium]
MSTNKMLIDAAHTEETRVSVLRDGRIEEFDYESASRRPLRGNIYLAKVTRVEPSLQAAFVDYGGNRHGFLAFNEIHPDYYQIPIADREALLEEEAEDARAASAAEEAREAESSDENDDDEDDGVDPADEVEEITLDGTDDDDTDDEAGDGDEVARAAERSGDSELTSGDAETGEDAVDADTASEDDDESDDDPDDPSVEALEDVPVRKRRPRRQYRIQEVIKRRQIILIQVVKEERGNKGAALTTYLSLAGRHTVLMPNTARGGGISRKITNPADRKRLRTIANELEVPDGAGLIIRTAGAARTKAEIKRDYEYLMRLWENVRELTLKSTAPALVYEEGNLIKRSIRDLYSKEIDEVLVAGDEAYKEAKDFMRMIMPSHAKNVKKHDEAEPLFAKYQIERNLNEMFSPVVTLPSGGYIVVNQTEALVAIDVNSGKSTRQSSIEETALSTNLEAAEELARQLKLRDLAGLIVIDFIDMDERRNNRQVERKMKDCLRHDRARIQVGRISHFGLMEMSRQRLRPGVLEGSTSPCQHCQGTGMIRSTNSVALSVIRSLEDTLMGGERGNLNALTPVDVALYILNEKREDIIEMEQRYGVTLQVIGSERQQGANYTIERAGEAGASGAPGDVVVQMDWGNQEPAKASRSGRSSDDDGKRKPRRRRRRRRDEGDEAETKTEEAAEVEARDGEGGTEDDEAPRKRRRRGRRGGRRNRRRSDEDRVEASGNDETADGEEAVEASDGSNDDADDKPNGRRRRTRGGRGRSRKSDDAETVEGKSGEDENDAGNVKMDDAPASNDDAPNGHDAAEVTEPEPELVVPEPAAAPKVLEPAAAESPPAPPAEPAKPARRGWWQRKSG